MNFVTVASDSLQNVINVSENPEYGFIRVVQKLPKFVNGWIKFEVRSALIHGTIEDLKMLDYRKDQVLQGKIVVKESLKPFNEKNPDRNLKIAGKTGVILRVDDQPIYRQTFYTTNMDEKDELIQHDEDCRNEIKEVMEAQKTLQVLTEAHL